MTARVLPSRLAATDPVYVPLTPESRPVTITGDRGWPSLFVAYSSADDVPPGGSMQTTAIDFAGSVPESDGLVIDPRPGGYWADSRMRARLDPPEALLWLDEVPRSPEDLADAELSRWRPAGTPSWREQQLDRLQREHGTTLYGATWPAPAGVTPPFAWVFVTAADREAALAADLDTTFGRKPRPTAIIGERQDFPPAVRRSLR